MNRAPSCEELEEQLRQQLKACALVCELGLEGELYERLVECVDRLAAQGARVIESLSQRFPGILVAYLVGEGVHHYTRGTYWPNLSVGALGSRQQDVGPQFEEALSRLGLNPFDDLVEEERATRYISRILIHGGIPRYSLRDFFTLLLLPTLGSGTSDASEMIAVWRARKTRFQGIDKPVERFLLRGGEVAVDLLDRCIDLVLESSRRDAIPRAEELGLPGYVVEAFAALPAEERKPSRAGLGIPRPNVELDSWDSSVRASNSLLCPATSEMRSG